MNDLKQKVVVITGASSGIGKACAEAFAIRGANLVLAARKYKTLCEIRDELKQKYQIQVIAIDCDVSKEEDCKNLIEEAVKTFKCIDILVNNAGISMRALFKDVDLSVLKRVMDVNFLGIVYCTKYALPEIQKTRGTIIGISSVSGYKGTPGRIGYAASKFAMNGFLDALRIENLKTGVHVMTVCPGFTATNIRNAMLTNDGSELGVSPRDENKMMTVESVANIIVQGVIKRKREIILTFEGKLTVILNKCFPSLTDKLIYQHFTKEKPPLLT